MQTNETQAEVALTPYLQQVMRRARELGFRAEAVPASPSGSGEPWVSIGVGSGTISVFGAGHHILDAKTQDMPAVALVQAARRVADAARLLLDVDVPRPVVPSLRMEIERDGREVEVEVEVEDGEIGRARMTDDERTEVVLTWAEAREAAEMWRGGSRS